MLDKSLDTAHIHYHLAEGILMAAYQPGIHITLDIAKEIVTDRLHFTQGITYPVLINSQGVISIDRAAREYFSSSEGTERIRAAAILVSSPFSSFLGNFFIRVNKTQMPVKIFTKQTAALSWLRKYL